MRWIMITRKLDPADDRMGFVMRWIEALAARLEFLDVICQETANPDLPENVRAHSMGKEVGKSRREQAWRLTQYLRALVPEADGVFCHMIPRYVLFAAPWTRPKRKPLLLWYTQWHDNPELRTAHALATHIVTASETSFPLESEKTYVMGHGIDTLNFRAAESEMHPPTVVLVGRLARVKRQDWLLRAAAQIVGRMDVGAFQVQLIGGPVEGEPDYPADLELMVRYLDPVPPVVFTGPLPHTEVGERLQECAVAVNLTYAGSFDKAGLEAMLAAKPLLTSNPAFLPLLAEYADLLYVPEEEGDEGLAERLAAVLALAPYERAEIGRELRERVIEQHSLGVMMDRLVHLMFRASQGGAGRG